MKTIFYSKDAQFDLTDEEFNSFLKKANSGERVWIPRLKVMLSSMFIWAGEKPESSDRKRNRDGQWCIKKFGEWFLENNQEIKVDISYYPELTDLKDQHNFAKQLPPSSFGKQLASNL